MFENTNNEYVKTWIQEDRDIIYLHGSESGPIGGKYTKLLEAFPGRVYAPDFRGIEKVEDRVEKLAALTEENSFKATFSDSKHYHRVFLVGSSLGGLQAALFADKYPDRVAGYLLLVPAFCDPYKDMVSLIKNVPSKAYILASANDEYIPNQGIIDFVLKHNVEASFVPDGHRLLNSLDKMVDKLRLVLED